MKIGGCLSQFWSAWRDREADPWVVEVLREGYRIPLSVTPPLAKEPVSISSYAPSSIKGRALAEEIESLVEKGAVELAPPSPGFYSRVFVVLKASGAWRPIIDLSFLNRFVVGNKFRMETFQSRRILLTNICQIERRSPLLW